MLWIGRWEDAERLMKLVSAPAWLLYLLPPLRAGLTGTAMRSLMKPDGKPQ